MSRSTRIRRILSAAREAKVRSLRWIKDWDAGVPPKGQS
ncbi:protein of unassigned function [Methylobacterium oryzae CBMB20]|uniref:Protein of unassigned function n=1 Tax=Methylobacterium oryzae CBMB20 TaxID=693986 RepID=A0A089QAE3_9HYPH|nr:protein of unassigned function [Methylobacterium oryzae CBMB20]